MAADLHIHVLEGCTEWDVAQFQGNTLGTRFCGTPQPRSSKGRDELYSLISNTPTCWIGEVSWLKAAVFGSPEEFIPATVNIIHDAIGDEFPVLNEELRDKILEAFNRNNATSYSLTSKEEVEKFLQAHVGKKLFTISW